MILINLLPQEQRKKKIVIPKPVKRTAWGLLAAVFVLWAVSAVQMIAMSGKLSQLKAERKAITGDLANAEKVIAEMNQTIGPKKSFLDRFDAPEAQWDQILNLLSDVIPDGLWLNSIRLDDNDRVWLRIEGYAKPEKQKAEMQAVGEFVVAAKKQIEVFIGQLSPDQSQQMVVQTSTEQREIEKVPVIQFVIEFKKI